MLRALVLCWSVLITNLKIQHKAHCRECLCYRSFTAKSPYWMAPFFLVKLVWKIPRLGDTGPAKLVAQKRKGLKNCKSNFTWFHYYVATLNQVIIMVVWLVTAICFWFGCFAWRCYDKFPSCTPSLNLCWSHIIVLWRILCAPKI